MAEQAQNNQSQAPQNYNKCIEFFRDPDEGEHAPRQRWAGSTTFVLAAIGSAIGLGNFWRFPYLTFKWGGGIWFIPYLIALMFLGLPMMLLELSLGQLFQRGDIGVFRGIHPRLYGVGLASVFSAFAINIFYTYLIAIAGCYFFAGFVNPLPWSIQRTTDYQSTYCAPNLDNVMWDSQYDRECMKPQECDNMYITEEWFRKDLLRSYVMTDTENGPECQVYDTKNLPTGGDGQVTEFSWQIMLALALTWSITYFCVFKGVKSSSYVVWFTVPGPIIFIFIMVMNNLCLPNADAGIRMYLRGEKADGTIDPPGEKLGNGQMWADAVGQIFFSLGVCMGVMTSYSSYNRKNKPIIRDVMVISFGNCAISFFAGFAVFSVVGYLQYLESPVSDNKSSSGLAFIAYPAAAEEMPGSNFWILLLGLTLFTLGIDTAFSLVEAISTVVYDTEKGKTIPRKLTALIVCILGWLGSLLFCPSWGYTHFDVADRYISVYLMFVLGIMQCFAAGWMFRSASVLKGENRTSIIMLSSTYWISVLILGPVTVFGLGAPINVELEIREAEDYAPWSMMWLGVVIFWVLNLGVIAVTFFMKKGTASDWYKNVLFYGAHELAELVASRSDELARAGVTEPPTPCWKPVFIFWWAFSIKYFIPWTLFSLMMWNFKADIDLVNDRGYGGYHDLWQVVGFIYPLIGLICFFLPICIVTTPEARLTDKVTGERLEVMFDDEDDDAHAEEEKRHIAGLQAQLDAQRKGGKPSQVQAATAGNTE